MSCTEEEWKELKDKELVGKVDWLFKKVNQLEEEIKLLKGGKQQ